MSFYEKIDEQNKFSLNKPADCDRVYYSELKEWYTTNAFRSFSIKLVMDQTIRYRTEGHEFCVAPGQFLVACRKAEARAYFSGAAPTRSLCIDICPQTVSEVFTVLTQRHGDLDNYLAGYFDTPQFYEHLCSVHSSSLGAQLQQLSQRVEAGGTPALNKEWFMGLAEKMIYQEYGNYLCLNQINSVKQNTKKELLRRLQVAKDYMDEGFLEIGEIREIAEHCAMSEYHFYRRFKEVYKRTPNQYLTEKKLQFGRDLLQQKQYTVTQVAGMCSYPDVFTFSKAFKRFFGVNPSAVR